jgi:hypothetical protein
MKFFNTSFSDGGFDSFQKLSRSKQIEFLKRNNPLVLESVIKEKLKGVKYGKSKRSTKAVKKSNRGKTSKES